MEIKCQYEKLLPVNELKPHPKNPNKHSKEQIARLAEILEYQCVRHPVIVSRLSGHVVVGHGRLEAMKKLGMKEVPVDYQEFKSEEQEYAFIVSDNAIAEWAELDLSMINSEVPDLGPDFEIDLLGLKDFEIEVADKYDEEKEDDVPEEPKEPKTVLGDVYELGEHRLMCGDATSADSIETLFKGENADLYFTDPPYGIGYEGGSKKRDLIANDAKCDDLGKFLEDVFSIAPLNAGSPIYICSPVDEKAGSFFNAWQPNWKYQSCLVWVKHNASFTRCDYHTKHEFIHYGWRLGGSHVWEGDRKQDTVWEFNRPSKSELHPTMKPIPLIEYALKNSSKKKSVVYDSFGGSGSTLIACEKTNRKCFMMELEPKYCDVIVERWCQYTGQKKIKLNGQEIEWQKKISSADTIQVDPKRT